VVWTKEILAFSQEDKYSLLDSIPLAEISGVEEVGDPDHAHSRTRASSWKSAELGAKANSFLSQSVKMLRGESILAQSGNQDISESSQHARSNKCLKAFLIKTIPGGYNSGREYHFRPETAEQSHSLIPELRAAAKAARWKAFASTRFRKSQEMVRTAYDSVPFQFTVAFLIIAVRRYTELSSTTASLSLSPARKFPAFL
jgi:hypothetical protein